MSLYQAYRRPVRGPTVREVGVVEIGETTRYVQFRMELTSFVNWQDAFNLATLLADQMSQVQRWASLMKEG